jgi:hypothetical protein
MASAHAACKVAALPVPAGDRQPGLGIGGIGLHELLEECVGRGGVLEFLLEDGGEQDEGLRAIGGRLLFRIERFLRKVKPNQSARDGRSLLEVAGAGLSTTALPVAKAGPIFQIAMMNGKFHGVIDPTTPIG